MPRARTTPPAGLAAAAATLLLLLLLSLPAGASAARMSGAAELRAARATGASASASASAATAGDMSLASRIALLKERSRRTGQGVSYTDEAAADLVPHLPGWGAVDGFNLFSGYVTVDDEAGRALFYILAEAASAPQTSTQQQQQREEEQQQQQQQQQEGQKQRRRQTAEQEQERRGQQQVLRGADGAAAPLVLWLNGGPGCSSIGGGFMTELGPFYPLPGGRSLQANPHAWNAFASVLFVESPAFVGFSYSNTTSDAIVGDARTAADSRAFLVRFLERFPHFKAAPFYVAGESYAGHYVPHLALAIVEGNKAAAAAGGEGHIPLQGFLVGNPWTDAAIDNLGAVDYWWSHALISDQTAQGIRANCNFSRIGPLDPHPMHSDAETRDEVCDEFCNRAFDELGAINIYEIYADLCAEPNSLRGQVQALAWALSRDAPTTATTANGGSSNRKHPAAATALAARAAAATAAAAAAAAKQAAHMTPRQRQEQQQQQRKLYGSSSSMRSSGDGADPGYDPCVDDEAETWLNVPEVQRALHANQTVKLPWRWTDCTRSIVYSREDLLSSMLPVYERLLQANLRMLVFSGDVDGIVPVVGTRRWVASLRLKEKSGWRPWEVNGQVGGYVVEYGSGLTFATVRGAGHMVPYVQPARGAHLARAFLEGKPL